MKKKTNWLLWIGLGLGGAYLAKRAAGGGMSGIDYDAEAAITSLKGVRSRFPSDSPERRAIAAAVEAFDAQVLYEREGGVINWYYAPGWAAVREKIRLAEALTK